MASTYSTNIRLEKQGDGENPNTWGTRLNTNAIDLIDAAVAGYTTVGLSSANVSLTSNNGSSDQSRVAMIEFSGTVSASLNVTLPSSSKFYIVNDKTVRQNSATITMKTAAGSGYAVNTSAVGLVMCDAVSVFGANSNSLGLGTAADLNYGTSINELIPVSTADIRYVPTSTATTITGAKTFGAVMGAVTTLTDAASIAIDMVSNNHFVVSLGGNRTMSNPTNETAGQVGHIYVIQDATCSRTLAFSDSWKFPNGTAPTMSTSASSVDMIAYSVRGVSVIDGIHVTAFS